MLADGASAERMPIDLTDGALFAQNEFWSALADLRANDPIHFHPDPAGGGFWVVTRHHDIMAIYNDEDSFSSRFGVRLGDDRDAVAAVSQRMLIVSDPPAHTRLKRVLDRSFTPAEMARLRDRVRRVVRRVLDGALAVGDIDFLDVAAQVPDHVIGMMMGIPRDDCEWLGEVTSVAFEGADERARAGAHRAILGYFTELLATRRRRPGRDLISRIAADERSTEAPGEERPLSDEEIVVNCDGVLAGAHETTRSAMAGAALAFLDHPDQWRALRRAGPSAVPGAVEEVLRWTVPGVHALRTAVRATEIGGVRIAPGDRVTLWNASANRDEAVFADAHLFRVDRTLNPHVTFGAGRHRCLGARLARLELTVFLEEFLHRVRGLEPLGAPEFTASNFAWGLRSLPVRLLPA